MQRTPEGSVDRDGVRGAAGHQLAKKTVHARGERASAIAAPPGSEAADRRRALVNACQRGALLELSLLAVELLLVPVQRLEGRGCTLLSCILEGRVARPVSGGLLESPISRLGRRAGGEKRVSGGGASCLISQRCSLEIACATQDRSTTITPITNK